MSQPPASLRILQLLPALNEGGVERGTVELNREFAARGHESHVASRGGRLVEAIQRDGGFHHPLDLASKNPLTAPWRALRLARLFDRLEPSVIHARSRVPAWLAVLANRRPRRPFVTTVHGLNRVNAYSRVMTFGDRVICVSELVAEYVRQHYRVDPGRIRVIQRGVDLRHFDPARLDRRFIEEFRRRHGLEGRRVALSVGRITWLKDYESFIRAVALVRRQRPDLVGVIAGGVAPDKQRYFESLQALCRELGV
ncbi:MAG: glycosyltransferase, partial [Verrucomicrobia bacterium]